MKLYSECSRSQNLDVQDLGMDPRWRRHDRPAQAAGEELYPVFKTYQAVAQAIRDMVVRGAPAIGVAAAMGVALGGKAN
jgi:hypothetical protein